MDMQELFPNRLQPDEQIGCVTRAGVFLVLTYAWLDEIYGFRPIGGYNNRPHGNPSSKKFRFADTDLVQCLQKAGAAGARVESATTMEGLRGKFE